MIHPRARSLLAEGFIVVAALAGAHLLVVEPRIAAERRARSALASMRQVIRHADELSQDGLAARAEASAAWMSAMSEQSGDAAVLYRTITELAGRHRIVIERVQPSAAHLEGAASKGLSGLNCSINATGDYEDLARFLDALEREAGFSAATAVRLTPVVIGGRSMVQASVETTHRAVRLDDLRAALAAAQERPEDEQ